jgi:hypothetical protein
MKKQMKKLVLAKETVGTLEESGDFKKVAGASIRNTVCEGCNSGFYTCPTSAGGGGSFLC